jgi:hypothetical protein
MTSISRANVSAEPTTNGTAVRMSQTDLDIVQLDLTLKNLQDFKNAKRHSRFHGDELIGVSASNLSPY